MSGDIMDSLFEIPPTLSPRLQWIDKHQLRTQHCAGLPEAPWCAWLPENDWDSETSTAYDGDDDAVGFGLTEDEAVIKLAIIHTIPLWNEEVKP